MTIKNQFSAPKIGDRISFRKTMTVAEQSMLTGISGNLGGLYVDRRAAAAAGMDNLVVFEMAASALLSTSLSRLAGPQYRIAKFAIDFERAVCIGTTLEATATLTAEDGDRLTFSLSLAADGVPLSSGEAVMVPVREG